MGFTSSTSPAGPAPVSSSTSEVHLIRGALIGLLAALVLMPIHSLVVSWGYNDGYYTDYPQLLPLFAIMVALAVRFGTNSYGALVAVIAIPLTVMYMLGSEYLVARFLVNQTLIEDGYTALPLIVSPLIAIDLLWLYIQNDPVQLIMWVIALVGAGFLVMLRNLSGGTRYQLSGKAPAALGTTSVPAQPSAVPSPAPVEVRMEDIPADAHKLGQPLQTFETRVTALILMAGLFILLALACMVWAYFSRNTPSLWVLPIGFAVLFFGLGGYRIILAILNLDNQVIIFADGISIRQKGTTVVMRWSDIRAVWQRQYRLRLNLIPVVDQHYYRIERSDGFTVKVDKTYGKIGDLGAAIQTAITRIQMPKAVEALKRGEGVPFGQYIVRPDALVYRDSIYPWQEIGSVGVWQSSIRITKKKGLGMTKWSPDMSTVPNLHLFFTLVYALLKGALPSDSSLPPEKKGFDIGSPYDQVV